MLNQPLEQRSRGQNVSRSYTTPAPYGGWNARDSVADMRESDALILDNWFPRENRVTLRNGFTEHATSLPSHVETLMVYRSPTAEELWAVSGGNIYNASAASQDVGAAAVTGLTNSRFQHVNFGTAGGHYTLAVNGEDDLQYYDGSSWDVINSGTTPAITGVDTADLIDINIFKRRVFFVEKNTLSFWYLPVNSIGGAAEEFDLAPLCRYGGYLVSMGTWSRETGEGPGDYAVFVTSEGEVVVYQGTDPGTADSWSLVGVYKIGRPIGRRCLQKIGPELFIITEDGFYPVQRAIASSRTTLTAALSDKIRGAVRNVVESHEGNFGWEMIFYPKGGWLLVNIPIQENGTAHQYVANTTTGAWCRFTGMDANCWAIFDGDIYFGGDQTVFQADDGQTDNGTDITSDVQQAYTYLGAPGLLKKFSMLRPILTTDGAVSLALSVNVDFEDEQPTSEPDYSNVEGATWNEAVWDEASWQAGPSIAKAWQSVGQIGIAGSIRMQTATQEINLSWAATNWIWQVGGML